MSLQEWFHGEELHEEHQRLHRPMPTRGIVHRSGRRLSLQLHRRLFGQGLRRGHRRVRLKTVPERWRVQRPGERVRVRVSCRFHRIPMRDRQGSLQPEPMQKFGALFQHADGLLLPLSGAMAREELFRASLP